jgi:hypothetical protein
VIDLQIRNCSARIEVLQNQFDASHNLERRALLSADHPEGATGMVIKDYRGQKARKEIWKFDAALVAQILKTLKQAAIEVGQWNEKRQLSSEVGIQRNHVTA